MSSRLEGFTAAVHQKVLLRWRPLPPIWVDEGQDCLEPRILVVRCSRHGGPPPFANASIALSCFTSFMCELGIPAYPLSSLALRSQFFCYESFAAASLVRPFVVFVVRLRVVLFRYFYCLP